MKLKLVTYNIHKGFAINNRRYVLEAIRDALRRTDADVLLLQEVLGAPEQFEFIADSFWSHSAYGKNAVYSEGHHGNAILSKYPLVSWSNKIISDDSRELRGLLKMRIRLPEDGKEILLANTHLDLLQRGRDYQVENIVQDLKAEDVPWVLVGDFNDWNKKLSPVIETELGAKEAHRALHGKLARTFPSFFPVLSLDRAYVRGMKPLKVQRLMGPAWKKLSDHIPLYLELTV